MSQAKAFAALVREYVGRTIQPLAVALAEVSARLDALPAPQKGDPGLNGKDADPELVRVLVAEAVKQLPPPRPGKDAPPVDEDAIIASVLAKVPSPKDGRDADPELVRLVVDETLPGMVDQVRAVLDERIQAALPGLKGEPGKDAEPADEVAISARVLSQIPAPKDGEPGKDGKSLTPEDVRPLLERIVADAVAKLPPPKDGEPGRDGSSVHPDTVRAMVVDQVRAEMSGIPTPKDGEPGRDATAIEYRDGIDESKSYPRGTHALYRGGTIIAMRATDPVKDGDILRAGWAVAMNGIDEEAEEASEDFRTVRRVTLYTSGKRFEREFKTGAILDRGVWNPATVYERGDVVTWGGSSLIAQRRTEAKPETPEARDDWRLLVKRGRDGKDGKNGERVPQGPDGKSGDRY